MWDRNLRRIITSGAVLPHIIIMYIGKRMAAGTIMMEQNFPVWVPDLPTMHLLILNCRREWISREDIPADLVTPSGSCLDPDISPEAAEIQIPRIAEASGLSREEVEQIVEHNTEGKLLGIFGEETVHVLQTNLEIAEAMGILGEAS